MALLDLTKTLYNNLIELSLRTMIDQIHAGKLIEMRFGYDINESVRLDFNANNILHAIWLGQDYKGKFENIAIGSSIKNLLKIGSIFYDESDEMHYFESEDKSGIGFYAQEESITDNPNQNITLISIHNWLLQT